MTPFKGTKKQKRQRDRSRRVITPINTGTRTMKSKKDYNRKDNKIL